MWASASVDQLRALTEELGSPVFVLQVHPDHSLRMLCVNSRFEILAGSSLTSLAGRSPQHALPAPAGQTLAERGRLCVITGQRVEYEQRLELQGGTRWWHMTLSPIRDPAGRIGRLLGTATDMTEQRRADARVRESEARYRRLVNGLRDAIFEADIQGGLLFVNPAWTEVTGVTAEDSLQRALSDFVWREDRERFRAMLQPLLRDERNRVRGEYRLVQRDGGTRWVDFLAQVDRDPEGRPTGITGTLRDVTEQRETRAALEENAALMELFFTQSLDGLFFMMLDQPVRWDDGVDKERVLDYVFAHQRMTRVNDALLRQYGLPEEALLGMTPADFFVHDPGEGRRVWREFFDKGRLHVSTEERRADGEPIWIEGDYICIRESEGRIAGHFGVQREVTDQVLAERQLRASERRLRLVADNLPALISHVGADLRFQYNNRMYRDWLGLEPEQLVGQPVSTVSRYVDRPLEPCYQRALNGERLTFEVTGHFGGADRYLQVTYVPDLGETGEVEGFYSLSVDITDRRNREVYLERQAVEDGLTGLLNRRGFMDRLEHALARSKRLGQALALLFLDLDDFKRVNDELGHDAGDQLIRTLAQRLQALVRETDSVARLAGDEFVILLEGLQGGEADAVVVARKVLAELSRPVSLGDATVEVSGSVGISLAEGGEPDPQALLREADAAMYRAKRDGKGRWFSSAR
ncbi:PAS domain-containing protein [Ectothiorhodospiraceae bacterium WFHF3C12]|nr:PAS domain-containing protein [Ectothiorhodospiraceae bacterium WFHF3C12]